MNGKNYIRTRRGNWVEFMTVIRYMMDRQLCEGEGVELWIRCRKLRLNERKREGNRNQPVTAVPWMWVSNRMEATRNIVSHALWLLHIWRGVLGLMKKIVFGYRCWRCSRDDKGCVFYTGTMLQHPSCPGCGYHDRIQYVGVCHMPSSSAQLLSDAFQALGKVYEWCCGCMRWFGLCSYWSAGGIGRMKGNNRRVKGCYRQSNLLWCAFC